MFNNNYDRNSKNYFNNSKESQDEQIKYKINNNIDFGRQSKSKFFEYTNLFNQSHSNNNINRNIPAQINSTNKNLFLHNTQYKIRDLNYTNYSNFYRETNNQPYPLNNNFQNIHNINTINNNFQNQNLFRYNDLNTQKNEMNYTNISNGNDNNMYSTQQKRSYSEINRRSTPINGGIDYSQSNKRLFNGIPINYSEHNFYHGKNTINQEFNNNNYNVAKVNQSSPINNNNIITNNNKYNYNSSNNTINNFYEEMQKEKEKERRQKENYSEILKKQIEEKKKRKEIEKQKEKEYDLRIEKQYQEYLKQQKEIENNNQNNNQNDFEKYSIKRPISNREKPISDIINEMNINNMNNSKQNIQLIVNKEKIKNRTNYNNFNSDNFNEETKTRNKGSTASSSFINSGKGIIDSFYKQIKSIEEFQNDFNNPLTNNIPNKITINTKKEDSLGFTLKNKAETEEMIDKLIKETDDYLQETLQQTFPDINNNREEKEKNIYDILNKEKNQSQNEKIEFKGTFGKNQIINTNLQKTSQFNIPKNEQMQNNIEKKINMNSNKIFGDTRRKEIEINNQIGNSFNNNNKNNNRKKEDNKNEKKNEIINIDELLKGIDLKALNYRSKYEEVGEDKNKETIKKDENRDVENQKIEESMKSFSKLVSSKTNNETWKKDSLEENIKDKENINDSSNELNDSDKKEQNNKDEIENKKKIMNFLNNRKKDKKIKYKLKQIDYTPFQNTEENINSEIKQQAINSSIKLNGPLNPNLKITFGKDVNLLSNQSIKFNQEKTKNNNISNFTFGKNNENAFKFNTSIKNVNENINNESLEEEDEEKYDIKINDENDINYDNMLNKNDDIKFLDFDNFLDISKINKNINEDDLCNIRYTPEEELQQNKKVTEALNDAIDSSDEEELNKVKTNLQDNVNFSGGNTIGLNKQDINEKNKLVENENNNDDNVSNKNNEKLNKEEIENNIENSYDKQNKNSKKEEDIESDTDSDINENKDNNDE